MSITGARYTDGATRWTYGRETQSCCTTEAASFGSESHSRDARRVVRWAAGQAVSFRQQPIWLDDRLRRGLLFTAMTGSSLTRSLP